MMQKSDLRISIVIPVYNEAERLGACLEAITSLDIEPFEVIVVDNNSTDTTAVVASRYNFVNLINEPRQGVIHARTRGFDVAKGDVIARIDGDTILPNSWLSMVAEIFADPLVTAVSGAPDYYDFIFPRLANKIDHFMRARLARNLGDNNFLYGANMAIRRSAWLAVRDQLCSIKDIHEDFDLAIHLQNSGFRVDYSPVLIAGVSSRRINDRFTDYVNYTLVSPRTYSMHNLTSRRHMYPVLLVCWLCQPPGRLLSRGFNYRERSFSLRKVLIAPEHVRVNPATFVD